MGSEEGPAGQRPGTVGGLRSLKNRVGGRKYSRMQAGAAELMWRASFPGHLGRAEA